MADLSVVYEKLLSFDDADDLAEFFRGYGIQAQPRNSTSCAISQFVEMETGLSEIRTGTTLMEIGTESYDHSAAMEQFVANYDMGYYPDLIEAGYVFPDEEL